ncbi:uncharacterized protein BDZ99DRAFT_387099 [Mytilinidion resinicola]|uniref:Uncharacterized protein n=1 Tax=Mytilinidion resinicola TaxID=574789 RepID=A0A6A6YNR4_9PEZI|nr:uncharacterized protein BDZ99DRAFT_387099 [Mytilinidion resinicola]KAF2810199.1 hypothetical protein BDZ99DRAFT_387099 [Mytilinidion resinicola]
MRYIRFLKPPRLQGTILTALVTIASDLGDSFLAEDVVLAASLCSDDTAGEIALRKALKWTSGMRSLPVAFDIGQTDIEWPVQLHVSLRGSPESDHFEMHHSLNADLPSIVSAWSGIIDPPSGLFIAEKKVERRFMPLNNRTLSIWEETGESIARHLWDAGIALSAYLDRIVSLQANGLDILERVLSSATYKKLRVLELGTGCGIVGIGLAQSVPDCEVLLTDLAEAEEIVAKNIDIMNPAMSSSVSFTTLDWDEPLPQDVQSKVLDLIVLADCTYNADSSPSLVRTLTALVQRSPKAIVLVAMKVRHSSEAAFFDFMFDAGFVIGCQTALQVPGDEEKPTETVDVYVFHGKTRPLVGDTSTED